MSAPSQPSPSRAESPSTGVERRAGGDPLTAPAQSLTHRQTGALTLRDCWRAFVRQPSPPYLFGAVALVTCLRLTQGLWSWRDLVMALGLLSVTPFVEWAIHSYLLHSRALPLFGRELNLLSAREHRAHHRAPAVLAGVLIPPYGVAVFLALIAATNWLLSYPIALSSTVREPPT
jgi:hypothetical protein